MGKKFNLANQYWKLQTLFAALFFVRPDPSEELAHVGAIGVALEPLAW